MVHTAGIVLVVAALATVSSAAPTISRRGKSPSSAVASDAVDVGINVAGQTRELEIPGSNIEARDPRRRKSRKGRSSTTQKISTAANTAGQVVDQVAPAFDQLVAGFPQEPPPASVAGRDLEFSEIEARESDELAARELYFNDLVTRAAEEAHELEARSKRHRHKKTKSSKKKNKKKKGSRKHKDKASKRPPGQPTQPVLDAAAGGTPELAVPPTATPAEAVAGAEAGVAASVPADPSQQPPAGVAPVVRDLDHEDLESRDFWDGVLDELD